MIDTKFPVTPMFVITTTMTEDAFFERFLPIKNPFDDGRGFVGHMFETYGQEHDFVRQVLATEPGKVWTVTDCDGRLFIQSGYHWVNRFGYLISEIAREPDTHFDIATGDPCDDEEVLP